MLNSATVATPVAALVTIAPDTVATPIDSGAFIVQGSTLSHGSWLVLSGTTFAAGSARALLVNGATFTAPTREASAIVLDMVLTAMTELIVGGTTFAPGQTVVVSGITFDIPVSGGGVRVNSKLTQLLRTCPVLQLLLTVLS